MHSEVDKNLIGGRLSPLTNQIRTLATGHHEFGRLKVSYLEV
jgi:hypothetical protein